MNAIRHIKLVPSADGQTVTIPADLALPGEDAVLRKENGRIVIEAEKTPGSVAELLASWESLDEEFPEVPDPPSKPEKIF